MPDVVGRSIADAQALIEAAGLRFVIDPNPILLPPGDHSIALYMEDWGGRGWIAATVKADGQVISATGDGSWLTDGPRYGQITGSSWTRGLNWAPAAADGSTGLLTNAPTDWHQPWFDDSSWSTPPFCTNCTDQKMWVFAANGDPAWDDFDDLYADGAEFVWTQPNCYPGIATYTPGVGWEYAWNIGLFRTTFSL